MIWLRDRRFWAGVGVTVALGLAVPLLVIASGVLNMSALPDPDPLESTVGPWMLNRSRAHRAPTTENPFANSPTAVAMGLEHFASNCLPCHGAPSAPAAEFAQSLHPPAPKLTVPRIQALTDGELFWTVKNGVKMTGMPGFGSSHEDQEIWHIVAAVRHLSQLTPEEQKQLSAPSEGHHHHGDSSEDASSMTSDDMPGMTAGDRKTKDVKPGTMNHAAMKAPPTGADQQQDTAKESQTGTTLRWYSDFEQAASQAKISSLPILVDFTGSDWCSWCIKLRNEVFDADAFKQWAPTHVVLLEIDFPKRKEQTVEEKAKNKALMEKYAVEGFPTVVLLTPEGKELGRLGYQAGGPGPWIEAVAAFLKQPEIGHEHP